MILHNVMEDIVSQEINAILPRLNCCTCEKCRMDILAIALNALPPRYVVTEKGQMYAKLDELNQTFNTGVITALTVAAQSVRERPRH